MGSTNFITMGANYVLHRIELVFGKTPIGHIMMFFNKDIVMWYIKDLGPILLPPSNLLAIEFWMNKMTKQMGSGFASFSDCKFPNCHYLLAHNSSLVSTHFPNECLVGCNLCPSHLTT